MLQCAGLRLVLESLVYEVETEDIFLVEPGDIQITGPDTVYQGDEVLLLCVAGPSHPGQDNFISNYFSSIDKFRN